MKEANQFAHNRERTKSDHVYFMSASNPRSAQTEPERTPSLAAAGHESTTSYGLKKQH